MPSPQPLNRTNSLEIYNFGRRYEYILYAIAVGIPPFIRETGYYPSTIVMTQTAYDDIVGKFPENQRPGAVASRFYDMTLRADDTLGLSDDEYILE